MTALGAYGRAKPIMCAGEWTSPRPRQGHLHRSSRRLVGREPASGRWLSAPLFAQGPGTLWLLFAEPPQFADGYVRDGCGELWQLSQRA